MVDAVDPLDPAAGVPACACAPKLAEHTRTMAATDAAR
jgi:hypothetical protein